MNNKTGKVFHDLMKKGWIDRTENPIAWECFNEEGVEEELKTMAEAYQMELEKVKATFGDYEKEQIMKDLAIQKAITFVADAAVEK